MKTNTIVAAMIAAAVAMSPVAASATKIHRVHAPHHGLNAVQGYAAGSILCSSLFLILHAAYISNTQNRELTQQEAWGDVAGCFLPIIGPALVDNAFAKQR